MTSSTSSTSSPMLTILPGWGISATALVRLQAALRERLPEWAIEFHVPRLAGPASADWLDALDAALPDQTWLAGWSLGGMLATALAERRGLRTPGLVTLGSNASFVMRPDWDCAMPALTLADFHTRWLRAPKATFSRFTALVARGSQTAGALARALEQHSDIKDKDEILAGLGLLQTLDLREALVTLPMPHLHLFAEHDALVPASARNAIDELLLPNGETRLLSDTGHAFPLEYPEYCAQLMAAFIREHARGAGHAR